MKRWIPHLLYAGVVLALFFPVFFSGPQNLLYGDDLHHSHYFFRQFFPLWLRGGVFSWWNPYLFSGMPYFANPEIAPLYPFTILFLILPLPSAFVIFFGIHLIIGMVGIYFILSRFIDDISSWLGGILFGLSGFFMARLYAGHVGIIASASWTPWIFGLWILFLTKKHRRYLVLSALTLALQLLAGYQSISMYTFEILSITGVVLCFSMKSFRPILSLILLGIVGIGLSAFQLLPSFEFIRLSIRMIPLPFSWGAAGASTLDSLKMIVFPFIFGKPEAYTGPPVNFGEHAAYIGVIGLLFLFFAVILFFARPILQKIAPSQKVIVYPKKFGLLALIPLLILLVGIMLALSVNFPVPIHRMLWDIIPLFRSLRIPSRQLFLFVFGGSILSALGISLFRSVRIRRIVAILIVIELFTFGRTFIRLEPIPEKRHDGELIQRLKSSKNNLFRMVQNFGCWIEPRSALDFDEPMVHGIFSVTGYDAIIYRPYYDFIDVANGTEQSSILKNDVQVPYFELYSQALNFLNIRYIMTPTDTADPLGGVGTEKYTLVTENTSRKYRIYENIQYLPRFFFVPTITVFDTRADLVTAIRGQRIDFTKTIGVEKRDIEKMTLELQCKEGEVGSVDIISYTPNRIVLRATSPCNAFLSSSEVMYPGWEATIDGKKSQIITGNMAFRSLFVPKGDHTITYIYIPWIFYKGCAITVFTMVILLLWFIKKQKVKML